MIQSHYQEIVVRGEEFVSVRLMPEAYAYALALPLPEGGGGPRPSDLGRATSRIKYGVGAPDRCWARDYNLHDPYRGTG